MASIFMWKDYFTYPEGFKTEQCILRTFVLKSTVF
jgi:hypothetical protein